MSEPLERARLVSWLRALSTDLAEEGHPGDAEDATAAATLIEQQGKQIAAQAHIIAHLTRTLDENGAYADAKNARIAALEGWKAEALESLKRWHALGDVLLPFTTRPLGHLMQDVLAEQIPARIAALEESEHYAQGVADLAMKHRDAAESRVAALEEALRGLGAEQARLMTERPRYEGDHYIVYRLGWQDALDLIAVKIEALLPSQAQGEGGGQ